MSLDSYLEPPENFRDVPMGDCSSCDGMGIVANQDYDADYVCEEQHEDGCDCIEAIPITNCYKCDGSGEAPLEECASCSRLRCDC